MSEIGKIRLTGQTAEVFYELTSGHPYVGQDDFQDGENRPADGLISRLHVPDTVDNVGATITHITHIVEGKFPASEGDEVHMAIDLEKLKTFQQACLCACFSIARFFDVIGKDDAATSEACLVRAQFLTEAFAVEHTEDIQKVFEVYKERLGCKHEFKDYMDTEELGEDETDYEVE